MNRKRRKAQLKSRVTPQPIQTLQFIQEIVVHFGFYPKGLGNLKESESRAVSCLLMQQALFYPLGVIMALKLSEAQSGSNGDDQDDMVLVLLVVIENANG